LIIPFAAPTSTNPLADEYAALAAIMDFFADRVVPAAQGDPVDLWVYSGLPKNGWVPRSSGDRTGAEHPGSAIK